MVGFFPSLYPDELLYSACARYSEAVRYPLKWAVNKELFGDSFARNVSFPFRLAHFIAQLPVNSTYTVDQLIDNHTLLPFYSPFISPARVNAVRTAMKDSGGFGVFTSAGVRQSSIQPPLWLRFCPICADEDKRQWGEFYWHRLHQLPGLNVCIKHRTHLSDSAVRARDRYNETAYVSADAALGQMEAALRSSRDVVHPTLLEIASDAAWLFRQRNLAPGLEVLHSCYLGLLASKGLMTTWDRTRGIALTRALNKAFGTSFLRALQCEADERKSSNWIKTIVNGLTRDKVSHPLRHLLLIRFLEHTAESFFTACISQTKESFIKRKDANSFGSGPYPCLNPVCKNFRLLTITVCQVSRQYHAVMDNGARPLLGTFSCECGFAYGRRECDLPKLKKFEFSFVRAYGHVWEAKLAELWKDGAVSLRRIAVTLGTDTHNIKRKAVCLGLPFPRQTIRIYIRGGARTFSSRLNSKAQSHLERKRKRLAAKRAANRKG